MAHKDVECSALGYNFPQNGHIMCRKRKRHTSKSIVKSVVWPWSCFTAHGNQTVAVRGQQSPVERDRNLKGAFLEIWEQSMNFWAMLMSAFMAFGDHKVYTGCAAFQFLTLVEAHTHERNKSNETFRIKLWKWIHVHVLPWRNIMLMH